MGIRGIYTVYIYIYIYALFTVQNPLHTLALGGGKMSIKWNILTPSI